MKTVIAIITFLLISTSGFAGQKLTHTNTCYQVGEKNWINSSPIGDRNKRIKKRSKRCSKTINRHSKKKCRYRIHPNGSGL